MVVLRRIGFVVCGQTAFAAALGLWAVLLWPLLSRGVEPGDVIVLVVFAAMLVFLLGLVTVVATRRGVRHGLWKQWRLDWSQIVGFEVNDAAEVCAVVENGAGWMLCRQNANVYWDRSRQKKYEARAVRRLDRLGHRLSGEYRPRSPRLIGEPGRGRPRRHRRPGTSEA